jgi:CHAT domain-containing protein/tetratricopeptide (TPR) repeat protein
LKETCLVFLTMVGTSLPMTGLAAATAHLHCAESSPAYTRILDRQWAQEGATSVRVDLPQESGRDLLLRVAERGIDVEVEVLDRNGTVLHRADNPVERAASQLVFLPAGGPIPTTALIRAKGSTKLTGSVHLGLSGAAAQPSHFDGIDTCPAALRKWAEADAAYAAGRSIEQGRKDPGALTAHDLFDSAAKSYRDALGELPGTAFAADHGDLQLSLAAILYYELQDWTGSAEWASAAAVSFATAGNQYGRARAQAILAAAWLEMATQSQSATHATSTPLDSHRRLERARKLLRSLARFHAARHEQYEETLQINNIGLAYYYEARFEAALAYFSRALSVFERLGESARVAVALQNLALCDWGLGRLSAALQRFDKALALLSPVDNPNLYLVTLNNSGLAHYAAGEFDRSLQLQEQALDFASRSQADRARARSFYGMGVTYYAIGNRALAANFLRDALEIATARLDARIRVATLRALALIEYETGHQADAVAHNSEALRLATAPSARARILLRLAEDYASQGETSIASQLLARVITHPPDGDLLVRAMAMVQRGTLLRASGNFSAAERDLTQGLATLERFDSLAERFEALVELARLRGDQGNSGLALATVRRALRLGPEIRAQTANPEYRTSIAESLRPALEFEVDLLRARYDDLMHRGQVTAADRIAEQSLQAVDELRAVGFEEWRAERLEDRPDAQVAHLLAQSATIYRDMAERRFQLATRDDRVGPSDARAKILREDIGRLRVRLGVLNALLAERTIRPSGQPSSDSHPVSEWIAHRSELPPDTLILSYWIGTQQAYAWVVSQSDLVWVPLGPSAVIDRSARQLHDAMRAWSTVPVATRLEGCAELYRLIMTPLSKYVDAARALLVIPDGPLHYVPFAALRDTSRIRDPYLSQRLAISIAPALRLVIHSRTFPNPSHVPAATRVLIVADPVYSAEDPRLHAVALKQSQSSRPTSGEVVFRGTSDTYPLARLQSSAREADGIRALYDPHQVDLLEGLSATRDDLANRNLAAYRFIHIASHGLIDAEIPQLSALILGTYGTHGPVPDPYFRAGDFLARTFNADAIVLSACDTALGAESSSEGLIGLRYAALARGAHAVVASLWPVSDGIAAELMTGMYREMMVARLETDAPPRERIGQRVAASLAAATRHLLQRSPQVDPALWAPFTVYVAGD